MERERCQLYHTRSLTVADLFEFAPAEAQLQLACLHFLAISVCPECWVGQRTGGEFIYVLPELRDAHDDGGTNKNLLTVWPSGAGVRLLINGDDPAQNKPVAFALGGLDSYRSRMAHLVARLRGERP